MAKNLFDKEYWESQAEPDFILIKNEAQADAVNLAQKYNNKFYEFLEKHFDGLTDLPTIIDATGVDMMGLKALLGYLKPISEKFWESLKPQIPGQ